MIEINEWKKSMSQTKNDVSRLNSEVFSAKAKFSVLNDKMESYDSSIQSYSNLCDGIVTANTEANSKIDHLMDKVMTLELDQDEMRAKQSKQEEKLIDLQWRGMRENLIFTGIGEPSLARGEYENVELTLRNFLRIEMDITEPIPFDRVHRLGKFNPEQARPIIAKFERFRDKEFVRKQAPRTLVNKPFGVNEHYPVEMENKRKLLYPEVKKARRNTENKVKFVKDRLFVNGVEVVVEETENTNGQSSQGTMNTEKSENGKRVIYKSKPPNRNEPYQRYRGRDRYSARGRESNTGTGRGAGGWFTQHKSSWGMPVQNRAFETPLRNRYAAISRHENDGAKTIQTSG